jgi:hypothetical protein
MLICREKVGGSQRIPLLTLKKEKVMTVLKKDYEACFKEGFRLGTRIARARFNLMRASDSKDLGDEPMKEHYEEYAKTWTDLARNSGRKFCPIVAHEPQQPLIDLGDVELLNHKYDDKPEDEHEYQEVQVGGSGN